MTLVEHRHTALDYEEDITLLDLVDRLLDKGVVICGDLVISIAGVDLVQVSLRAFIASVETAMDLGLGAGSVAR